MNKKTRTEPFDQHPASPTQIHDNARIHRQTDSRTILYIYTKSHPTVMVSQKVNTSSQITKYESLIHCLCTMSPKDVCKR